MKTIFSAIGCLAIATIVARNAWSQTSRPGDLKVGDPASNFTVKDVQGKNSVTLSELKGKPIVLLFGSCT